MKYLLVLMLTFFLLTGCDDGSNSETSPLTKVSTNLKAIQSDYLPDSMSVAGKQRRDDDDICSFCTGDDLCFFKCQPAIVKQSLGMGKLWLQSGILIAEALAPHMKDLPEGISTFTDEDETIEIKKVDDETFSIRSVVDNTTRFYIDVQNNQYILKGNDPDEIPFELTITYTDQESWKLEAMVTVRECDSLDPKDPERFYLTISKSNGLWKGNFLFQNPRTFASDDATCSDGDTTTAFNLYTQFVAGKDAAKASSYGVPQSVSDYSFSTLGLDMICKTFYNTPLFGNQTDATFCPAAFDTFKNDYCFKPGSNEALWGDNCSTLSEAVAAESYLADSEWRFTPDQFYLYTITLPDSL